MSFRMVAVSGSLRAASSNTGLVRMATRLAPPEIEVVIDESLADLPYYNEDIDGPDLWPPAVVAWRNTVEAADALWLAAPEYNFGPSAVLKNAIDWITRPPGQHLLRGKVVSIVTSGGKGGGTRVQDQLNLIIGLLGNTMVTEPAVALSLGALRVSSDGTTSDPEVEELVRGRLAAVVAALESR